MRALRLRQEPEEGGHPDGRGLRRKPLHSPTHKRLLRRPGPLRQERSGKTIRVGAKFRSGSANSTLKNRHIYREPG